MAMTVSIDDALTTALENLATTRSLLVVTDFDGTIAGLAKDRYQVPINQRSLRAIKDLSIRPDTDVVVLSGRHLEGLDRVLDLGSYRITRVGSHGSEDPARPRALTGAESGRLDRIHADLEQIVEGVEGAFVEVKPFHRVLHFVRVSDPAEVRGIRERATDLDTTGLKVTQGKNIVEYSVSSTTKGSWLEERISRTHPTGVIFIGDDTTDEHGFEVLDDDPAHVSVKVGAGDTVAKYRVPTVDDVGLLLEKLAYLRMQHAEATRLGL